VLLAEAPPTRWTGAGKFWGYGGLGCPERKIEFARPHRLEGVEARHDGVCSGASYDPIARIAGVSGVWCEVRDGDELVLILPTANSPRGNSSSDRNYLFFLHFALEIGQQRVGENLGERVHEVGVHVGSEVSVR
jgi:hypothetical protein